MDRICRVSALAIVVLGLATACSERPQAGAVTVFAAASLTESFSSAEAAIEAAHAGLDVTFSFAGSGALVAQVRNGAPADVIATADGASMQQLVDAGLVEPPVTFARNRLEILVAPGNPKRVQGLADLVRTDLVVVVGDAGVPFGRYTAEALTRAGVTVQPRSREQDVRAAVSKVTSGEADATVVYATDVAAVGTKGAGVAIPDALDGLAVYPIAVVKATKARASAQVFVDEAVRGRIQEGLRAKGFLAPEQG